MIIEHRVLQSSNINRIIEFQAKEAVKKGGWFSVAQIPSSRYYYNCWKIYIPDSEVK